MSCYETQPGMTWWTTLYADGGGKSHQIYLFLNVANSTPSQYSLSTAVSPPGAGTTTLNPLGTGGWYNAGTQVAVTATPIAGYQFSGFTGIDSSSGSVGYVTMNANRSVTANFTAVGAQYTLMTAVSPAGAGTISPASGSWASGTQVQVMATPAAGYTFAGFSGSLAGTALPQSLTMNGNKAVTAIFTATPAGQYSLITSVNVAGRGTVTPGAGSYSSGSQVPVTATAAPGYTFTGFSGDLNGAVNPQSVTMNAAKSVTANFSAVAQQYYLTTAVNPAGAGTISPASGWYTAGTVVTVDAVANSGRTFVGFNGDLTGSTTPQSLSMSGAKTVTASFPLTADVIHAPSRLEVNLGAVAIDHYDYSHNWASDYPQNACPAGRTSVRDCYRGILEAFRAQGVTGVRFFFGLCGGFHSTPLQNCGLNWTQVTGPDSTWLQNLNSFFQDLSDFKILNVTPTPAHGEWVGIEGGSPGQYLPAASAPGGNVCSDTPPMLQYLPTEPYGRIPCHSTPPYQCTDPNNCGCQENAGFPAGWFNNDAYNCSPRNPIFVGWQNQYNVIAAVISAASNHGLTTAELDFEQELNPGASTAQARYMYDNAHLETGNPDVLGALRSLMGVQHAGKVTYSAAAINSRLAGFNCTNVYTDYARLNILDAIASAIGGGLIGVPSSADPQPTYGLPCGGTIDGMFQMPQGHTQPSIVDLHAYPRIDNGDGCYRTEPQAQVESEANILFSDVAHFMDMIGTPTATFIVGETFTNSNDGTAQSCDLHGPLSSALSTRRGYNASDLAVRSQSVVFRPFFSLPNGCNTYPDNQRVNYNNEGPFTPTQQ
jgi:hypothetical protein